MPDEFTISPDSRRLLLRALLPFAPNPVAVRGGLIERLAREHPDYKGHVGYEPTYAQQFRIQQALELLGHDCATTPEQRIVDFLDDSEEVAAMTPDEIEAELRAEGVDVEAATARLHEMLARVQEQRNA